MVLSLRSSGRRKNTLALFCLVLKLKVLLDHLWLNVGFFPSMCGKDLFYSAVVKRRESDHCGKVLQPLPEMVFLALMVGNSGHATHPFAEDVHLHHVSFHFLASGFGRSQNVLFWPFGLGIRDYLLLSCLFMALC